jgi:hypothetical protein
MKTCRFAAIVLFSVAAIQISASAACGGGGWHKRSEQVAVADSVPIVQAQNVSYEKPDRPADRRTDKMSLDSSRFDSVSSKLQLSDRQRTDVRRAKDDINGRANGLYDAKMKAESKLARCTGDCSSERRNLDQANSAYNSFSPTQEFDRRLSSILDEKQMNTYRASH